MKIHRRNFMKKIKKLVALVMASVSCFGTLAACGGVGDDSAVVIDETKTQLYVSNYDAGIGRTWVESIGAEFEKDFANYSFETGKTGVQVLYNHNRTMTSTTMESSIAGSTDNIFFTEGIDYPSLVAKDLLYDVTDVVNAGAITGVDAAGNFIRESTTIESKMDADFASYLNRGTTDNEKYYGMPYYLPIKGLIYDRELWNEKRFYLAKTATPAEIVVQAIESNGDVVAAKATYQAEIDKLNAGQTSGYWTLVNEAGEAVVDGKTYTLGRSAGPDGKYDTYDDGMPATVDEFYLLMEHIDKNNIDPLIFTGKFPGYADMLTNLIWINYEGKENLRTYYSLNGTVDELVVLNDDGNGNYTVKKENGKIVTESYTFNGGREDGYEVQRAAGKYYAAQVADKIATSDWLAADCDNTAVSHIAAQSKFLTSCLGDNKRIAMLCEGAWWQQESSDTFEIMGANNEKYSKANRDFGLLMAPNVNVDKLQERKENNIKNITIMQNDAFGVINGNLAEGSPQLAAAKAFFSYVNSDKMLNLFTEITSMYRAMNYKVDDGTYSRMSKYAKELTKFMEETTVVYPYTTNELFIKNHGYLANVNSAWNWRSKTTAAANSIESEMVIGALRIAANRQKGLNAETLFVGLYNYQKNTVWGRLI